MVLCCCQAVEFCCCFAPRALAADTFVLNPLHNQSKSGTACCHPAAEALSHCSPSLFPAHPAPGCLQKPARRGALAAAPGLAQAAIAQPPAQPELLQRLTQAVQGCAAPQEVHELVYHPQGSPFLQALLRVHQGNT